MSNCLLDSHDHSTASELFVVEGKSALQAVDQVRSRKTQAVFALQGKIPNVARHTSARVLENQHCRALIEALGCGIEMNCMPTRLRYGQIRLIADGDTDGLHSQVLILNLFAHFLRPLIAAGLVGIITAPRYRIEVREQSATRNPEISKAMTYLWTEEEKRRFVDNQHATDTGTITRFKGVASLSHDELFRLLIDNRTRRETLVSIDTLNTFQLE